VESQEESILILAAHGLRFATNHPYAATGILGAAIGSAVTYRVMTNKSMRQKVDKIFTPKVYELALSENDLQALLVHPECQVRIETPDMTLVITQEKREQLKQLLPDIDIDDLDIRR